MHLLIPFASALSPACAHALSRLDLPNLRRLLDRLGEVAVDSGDEYSLSPPHERVLGAAFGLQADDGCLPWAALQARDDGVDVGDAAWGLITPVHWLVGRDQITLADPDALQLDEAGSRACFDAVRELFDSEGLRLTWGAPLRWYATHPSFADLPTASIDRVVGRNVDLWLQADTRARLIRRLQNEVQMLLYTHPLNDAREAAGALTVNSFWLSGCGRLPTELAGRGAGPRAAATGKAAAAEAAAAAARGAAHGPAHPIASVPARPTAPVPARPTEAAPVVDASLRAPALQEDWAGWAAAWQALDAGPLAALLERSRSGEPVALTLCGERNARTARPAPRSLWQRLRGGMQPAELRSLLEAL